MATMVGREIEVIAFPVSERLESVIGDLMAIYTGAKFGYFDYIAEAGPTTAADLAVITGASVRAMSEWLDRQVAAGILEIVGPAYPVLERAYRLPAYRAELLVELEGPLAA